jgi:RNA polymerase sigma-70 factor (ECF subfamily)
LIRKERSQNLWHQASTLPLHEFRALWLRYGEDMPIKDIAKVLKKRPLTVRVLLHRARLSLAKKMHPTSGPEGVESPASVEHKLSVL